MSKLAYDDAIRVPAKPANETWLEHIAHFVAYRPVKKDAWGERIYEPLIITLQAFHEICREVSPYLHYTPQAENHNLLFGHPVVIEDQ